MASSPIKKSKWLNNFRRLSSSTFTAGKFCRGGRQEERSFSHAANRKENCSMQPRQRHLPGTFFRKIDSARIFAAAAFRKLFRLIRSRLGSCASRNAMTGNNLKTARDARSSETVASATVNSCPRMRALPCQPKIFNRRDRLIDRAGGQTQTGSHLRQQLRILDTIADKSVRHRIPPSFHAKRPLRLVRPAVFTDLAIK